MRRSLAFANLLVLPLFATMGDTSRAEIIMLGEDRLNYEVSGQGFPLVLVSGGSGMDLRQWDLITPALSRSYRVIRYDPRGIGRSDSPTVQYSDAEDLGRLLDHLGLERVGLIGLSSAGGFVLEFAVQYPERISGLVAVAPFIPGFEFSDEMMERLELFNRAAGNGREPFLDRMFEDSHFIPAPLHRSVRKTAREIMAYNFDKGAGFDASLPIRLAPPLIERLPEISSPVLLLAGDLDHPEVLRRNKFLVAEIRHAEEKTISQAGHNGPMENPAAFLDAMNSFLTIIAR